MISMEKRQFLIFGIFLLFCMAIIFSLWQSLQNLNQTFKVEVGQLALVINRLEERTIKLQTQLNQQQHPISCSPSNSSFSNSSFSDSSYSNNSKDSNESDIRSFDLDSSYKFANHVESDLMVDVRPVVILFNGHLRTWQKVEDHYHEWFGSMQGRKFISSFHTWDEFDHHDLTWYGIPKDKKQPQNVWQSFLKAETFIRSTHQLIPPLIIIENQTKVWGSEKIPCWYGKRPLGYKGIDWIKFKCLHEYSIRKSFESVLQFAEDYQLQLIPNKTIVFKTRPDVILWNAANMSALEKWVDENPLRVVRFYHSALRPADRQSDMLLITTMEVLLRWNQFFKSNFMRIFQELSVNVKQFEAEHIHREMWDEFCDTEADCVWSPPYFVYSLVRSNATFHLPAPSAPGSIFSHIRTPIDFTKSWVKKRRDVNNDQQQQISFGYDEFFPNV